MHFRVFFACFARDDGVPGAQEREEKLWAKRIEAQRKNKQLQHDLLQEMAM